MNFSTTNASNSSIYDYDRYLLEELDSPKVGIIIVGVAVGMFLFCLLGFRYCSTREEYMEQRRRDGWIHRARDEPDNRRDIRSLLKEDWVRLYNKTFDSNGNQLVLLSKHIIDEKSKTNEENSDSTSDTDESSSTSSHGDHGDIESGEESNRIMVEDSAAISNTGSNKLFFSCGGTCVICMEEFQKGDEIVWSSSSPHTIVASKREENTATSRSCQHVYHKECLVQYLASNSYRQCKRYNQSIVPTSYEIKTPCPMCRQRFCTLSDEHIGAAIESRCLECNDSENYV